MEKNNKTTWKIDPAHSRVGFTTKHLGIADVSGYFSDFTVDVAYSQPDFSDLSVNVKVEVASIHTGIEMRDDHLKSTDFFDVEKYPQMHFVNNKVEKINDTHAKLYGDLTLRGETKPIVLDVEHFGTVKNPMTEQDTAGFKISGMVNRKDFGVGTGFASSFISDNIKIEVDTEFTPGE